MSRYRLSGGELSAFCAQLGLMLGAGLTVYDGMEALAEAAQSASERELFGRIAAAVEETGSFSAALRRDGGWQGDLVEMIAIGERAGCLEDVMNALAAHYDREARISEAVRGAIAYPAVLCVMLLAILWIVIRKVLPVFQRVLGGMGVAMNGYCQWLMNAGEALGWGVLALNGLLLALILICTLLLHTGARVRVLGCIGCCFPPLRRLNRRISAARAASIFSMLLSGGFPMEEALEMLPRALGDRAAAAEMEEVRRRMVQGECFADALAHSRLFDPLHSRMIRVGAAVGREDQVMETVAHACGEAAENGISRMVSVIEPTLVALLCVVIGMMLLSVMLPMAGVISGMV